MNLKATNQKTPPGLVAVDMGNGLKWANMNVGAESVTDFGDYFAWGETMPYYQEGYSQESPCSHWIDGKPGYNWGSYSLCNGGVKMIKYCTSDSYGYVDSKTKLERTHDAASANWGGNWRTPTDDEWTWLLENCIWTWKTSDKGYLVTSNVNGNQIFLPAAGHRYGLSLDEDGSKGHYWSSSLYTGYQNCAWGVNVPDRKEYSRYFGLSVRPVTE